MNAVHTQGRVAVVRSESCLVADWVVTDGLNTVKVWEAVEGRRWKGGGVSEAFKGVA